VDDMDLAPDIDLSEPISVLLRIGTQRAHIKAENSEGAAALVQGRLGVEEYVRWLAVLWRIYRYVRWLLGDGSCFTWSN